MALIALLFEKYDAFAVITIDGCEMSMVGIYHTSIPDI